MKKHAALIMVIVAFILQPFFSGLLPAFLTPDFLFCIVLLIAITMEEERAILPISLGIILSIPAELFSNQFPGVATAITVILVIPIVLLKKHINLDHLLFIGALSVGLSLARQLIYWVVYRALGSSIGFLYMLKRLPLAMLPDALLLFVGLFFFARHMREVRWDSYFRVK